MSGDMSRVIVPKSDQLNSDDLIAGPITIKITAVSIKSGEQPVAISYEGDNGKPYKCCKSMARIMVAAWGADASKYVGRSLTLYRDPKVKWAGLEVGGIRISHMSHISDDMTMALTVTRQNRKPYTVRPLMVEEKTTAAPQHSIQPHEADDAESAGAAIQYISANELKEIEIMVEQKNIKGRFDTRLRANGIASPDKIPAHLVEKFKAWAEDAT